MVVWRVELVEGKDRLQELGPKEFDKLGKTAGLMVRMASLLVSMRLSMSRMRPVLSWIACRIGLMAVIAAQMQPFA